MMNTNNTHCAWCTISKQLGIRILFRRNMSGGKMYRVLSRGLNNKLQLNKSLDASVSDSMVLAGSMPNVAGMCMAEMMSEL